MTGDRTTGGQQKYVWPNTLRRSARPPMLVYLDLLHWVSLAKANSGHRDGDRYAAVLEACVRGVQDGAAVFPISDAIYMEVSKIGQHRQRRDLREVIERVSQYRVREVVIEINRMLYEGLADRNASLDDVLDENDSEKTRRFFNCMPSFDVSVSMKTAYHRNPAHRWKPNHIHDIDALASTVPYCDIVVTDKEAASHLLQTGVANRFQTTVLSRVEDLIPVLDSAAS